MENFFSPRVLPVVIPSLLIRRKPLSASLIGAWAAEFGLEESLVSAIEAKGHTVRRSRGEISGLHIIYRQEDGALVGGADPRREGKVVIP